MRLTFDDEVNNVIGCMEYFMERIGELIDESSLTEDEMVNDDAKKCLEFLHSLKETVRGACVLAVYAGADEENNKLTYGFGADGYEYLDKYLEGGMELNDKFGKEDFYNDYEKYFEDNIKPQVNKRSKGGYEYEINIDESKVDKSCIDEWGAAYLWIDDDHGVEYNLCYDNGECESAIYKALYTEYLETDYNSFSAYEIDFSDKDWKEKLVDEMERVALEFFSKKGG